MLKTLDTKLTNLNKDVIKLEMLKKLSTEEDQEIINQEIKEIYSEMKILLDKIKYIRNN